jgi:hypothetical protein
VEQEARLLQMCAELGPRFVLVGNFAREVTTLHNGFDNERDDYDKCRAIDRGDKPEMVHLLQSSSTVSALVCALEQCGIKLRHLHRVLHRKHSLTMHH